ncbi:MAG TPA: Rho termination factor [Actinomycetes bacterium]|nr:Rho termination factor [Actinomycetes bacterium]
MPRSSIKDEQMYTALRRDGASEEKAARISNAAAATSRRAVGRKGGKAEPYNEWTKTELLRRARELGVQGRSAMNKTQLIRALRSH